MQSEGLPMKSGHTSPITTVDVSVGEEFLASGGYDSRVKLWDRNLESPIWEFKCEHLVNLVRFDSKGERLAVAAADRKVYVLEVGTGQVVAHLGPFGDDANSVNWHPDNRHVVIVADTFDSDIHIWDVVTGTEVAVLKGHTDCICSSCFSPDGDYLASASEDGTARIWRREDGECLKVIPHPADPETIAWSPCGTWLATGCNDGRLRLWNAKTGEAVGDNQTASAAVRFVRFSESGKSLLAGSYDANLRVLSVPELKVDRTLAAPFQWERSAAFCGEDILVGSFGSHPILHRSGKPPSDPGKTCGINFLSSSEIAGESTLIAGRDDGLVVAVESGAILSRHKSIVNCCRVSPNGRLLASTDYAGELRVVDLATGQDNSVTCEGGPLNAVAWLNDGTRLAAAGYDGVIRTWSPDLKDSHNWSAHSGPVKSLDYCELEGILLAGSSDHSISGWKNGKQVFHVGDEGLSLVNEVWACAEASKFVTASRDGILRLWDLKTGALLERLPRGHFRSVKTVAMNKAGTQILSGSYDGTAILWSRASTDSHQWAWKPLALHGRPGLASVTYHKGAPVTSGWEGSVGLWSSDGSLVARHVMKLEKAEG